MCSIKISRKYIKKKTPYIVSPNLNLAKHLAQFIEYKTPNKKPQRLTAAIYYYRLSIRLPLNNGTFESSALVLGL